MTKKTSHVSKELFHLVVENVQEFAIFMTDLEGRIVSWNPGVGRLLGYSEEGFVGEHGSLIFTPEDRERGAPELEMETALKVGRAEDKRWHLRKDGSRFWADGMLMLLRDESGNVHGFAKIMRDDTERWRAEEQSRFLADLNQALQSLADSEDIVATSARLLGQHLEVDRCAYAKIEADDDHFLITSDYTRGVPSIVGRFQMSQFGAEALRQMRADNPYVVADVEADERVTAEDLAAYRKTEIRAVVSVPLHKAGRFAADMAVHQKVPRQWSPEEVDLVRLVANRCWEAIERARAARELRESEERYLSLLENAKDIIYSHDLRGNYLAINRAGEEITGYTREEILGGLNIARVVAPEYLEDAKRMTEQKLRDPSPTVYEIDIITRDERRLTLEVSTRIAYRDGQPVAVEGIARDITERKRGEAERQRLLEREQQARREAEEALRLQKSVESSLTLLVEASGVMLGSPSLESVQPAIMDISRRLVSADAYAIWRLNQATKTWGIVSSAGMTRKYSERQVPDAGQIQGLLEQPVMAEDVMRLPLLADRREMYEAEGVRSLLAVPLRIHGQTSGTLTFYYRQPHKFGETEVRVATALANLAGAAISSAELYDEQGRMRSEAEEAERRARFLSEASRILTSTLDYQKTLAQVAQLAVPDLADWCAIDMTGEGNSIMRLAVAHADPAKVEWANELARRYPADDDAPRGVPNVLRTGEPELYTDIPDEMLSAAAKDEEHLRIMREIGFTSAMVVPLNVHGRTLGAITFVSAESGRHFGTADLAFAEALARRAAAAINNARLYGEAQRARQSAEESSRLKDEFLATVSHELRTPLTAILGWAHLLRAGQVGEKNTAEIMETIERNARAQSQLIDDLLDVSRIITGKLRLDIRPVNPGSFIETAIEALSPAAEAKGVRVQKVTDTGVVSVAGDPARLQQVVWNLLSNAIKFTPKGGRVQVRLERVNSHIEIVVTDTGAGIKPDFLPYVFDRFRQADQTTTRNHGGLGLGLAIVRHLVELHGGTVQAESLGEGQGTTFTVKLPIVPIYQKNDLTERAHPAASETLPTYECPERLEGVRVLVVDDEIDTRELLRVGLTHCGAEVTTAGSVKEALEALEQSLPGVLISDIGMPDEDGYELIRKVRSLPAALGGKVPAIALTAYARTEDRLRAMRAGYQMHVTKPVEITELILVIASLFQRERES